MVWQFGRIPIIITLFIFSNLANVVLAEDLFAEFIAENDIKYLHAIKEQKKESLTEKIIKEELPLSLEEHATVNYVKVLELLKKSQ